MGLSWEFIVGMSLIVLVMGGMGLVFIIGSEMERRDANRKNHQSN